MKIPKNIHVVSRGEQWGALREGGTRASALFDTQAQAIDAGRSVFCDLEVLPFRVLRAGADLVNEPAFHEARQARTRCSWRALDVGRKFVGGTSIAVREQVEDRLVDIVQQRCLAPGGVQSDPEARADFFQCRGR